jgi:hypothetical protein
MICGLRDQKTRVTEARVAEHFQTQARPERVNVQGYIFGEGAMESLHRPRLLLIARARELQRKRQTLIQRALGAKFFRHQIFKIEEQRLAFPKNTNIKGRHRAMLNLVAEAHKKLKIRPLRRVICSPLLLYARHKLPSFSVPIYQFEVSSITFFSVERLELAIEKNGMKKSGPSDTHQNDEAAGSKARSRSVVGFHREQRTLASLTEVSFNFFGQSRHPNLSTAEATSTYVTSPGDEEQKGEGIDRPRHSIPLITQSLRRRGTDETQADGWLSTVTHHKFTLSNLGAPPPEFATREAP